MTVQLTADERMDLRTVLLFLERQKIWQGHINAELAEAIARLQPLAARLAP